PGHVRVEVVIRDAELHERIRRQTTSRCRCVEVDELVRAHRMLAGHRFTKRLEQREADARVATALGHLLRLRLLRRKTKGLNGPYVPKRERALGSHGG